MKIAFDIDGVLADFLTPFHEVIRKLYPGRIDQNYVQTSWGLSDVLTKEELKIVLDEYLKIENFWQDVPAFNDNVLALQQYLAKLMGAKAAVYFVTCRPNSAGFASVFVQTRGWLQKWQLMNWQNTSLIVVDAAEDKASLYKALKVNFSIDDKAETVREASMIPGHSAWLLDRTYNRQPDHEDLNRVKTLEEFIKIVLTNL